MTNYKNIHPILLIGLMFVNCLNKNFYINNIISTFLIDRKIMQTCLLWKNKKFMSSWIFFHKNKCSLYCVVVHFVFATSAFHFVSAYRKSVPFVELRRITYRDNVERGLSEENAKHLTSSAALVEISNSSNVTAGTSFVELLREKFPRRETRRRQKLGICFKV